MIERTGKRRLLLEFPITAAIQVTTAGALFGLMIGHLFDSLLLPAIDLFTIPPAHRDKVMHIK